MTLVPSKMGLENIHASTFEFAWNPAARIRIRLPGASEIPPLASNAETVPFEFTPAKVAFTDPVVTMIWLFSRVTVESAATPFTCTTACPVDTCAGIGAIGAGTVVETVVATNGTVVVDPGATLGVDVFDDGAMVAIDA